MLCFLLSTIVVSNKVEMGKSVNECLSMTMMVGETLSSFPAQQRTNFFPPTFICCCCCCCFGMHKPKNLLPTIPLEARLTGEGHMKKCCTFLVLLLLLPPTTETGRGQRLLLLLELSNPERGNFFSLLAHFPPRKRRRFWAVPCREHCSGMFD